MTDDPQYYHRSQSDAWPPRPLYVTGFTFTPAAGTIDFSGVPGFDLGRLQGLWHVRTNTWLYARPLPRPLDLVAVDGIPVPGHPTSGKVLRVKPDTSRTSASDEITALYDPP